MYKRPDSDGVDGAVLIKPEPPAVGANAGGWFSALITRNRAPTKCTAAFLNEIIEEARNLADAAGVLWKTRPDDRRNLLLSVRAIVAAEAPAQVPQFTNYHSAPTDNDIGDKLVGFLWRNGCDEWRLVNNPAVPGTKHWIQTRGAKTIYTDNASRAANSVRNLQAGNSWDDFCDLEFHTTGGAESHLTTKLRRYESARKVGMQANEFLPVQIPQLLLWNAQLRINFALCKTKTQRHSMSAKSWGFIDRNESPAEKNAPTKTPRFVKCRRRK